MTRPLALSAVILASLALAACGDSTSDSNADRAPRTDTAQWLLDEPPADAVPVAQAKSTAAEGDTIVVRGIIGGSKDALTPGSSVFRIIDAGVENECTSEDDHCPTPWDYCCATPESIIANSATVQITSDTHADPAAAGLEPLDEVIVIGTVAPRPDSKVLTIKATGVHRVNG